MFLKMRCIRHFNTLSGAMGTFSSFSSSATLFLILSFASAGSARHVLGSRLLGDNVSPWSDFATDAVTDYIGLSIRRVE